MMDLEDFENLARLIAEKNSLPLDIAKELTVFADTPEVREDGTIHTLIEGKLYIWRFPDEDDTP